MKKIVAIGMGDVLKGDYGAGCTVLEKLAETLPGKEIDYAYLGEDTRFGCGFLYGTDLAVMKAVQRIIQEIGKNNENYD